MADEPKRTTSAEPIDDIVPPQLREADAQVSSSTKQLLLRIPPEVQKQIDNTAADALEDVFSTLLRKMVRPARDRANIDAGLDVPLIKGQHIYEVKQSVLRSEFRSNLPRWRKISPTLTHLCAAIGGGCLERVFVEGKLGPIEVVFLLGAVVTLIALARAEPLDD